MSMYQKTYETYLRARDRDPDAVAAVGDLGMRVLRMYFDGGSDSAIARCMGLPPHTACKQLGKLRRDLWLCRAAAHITTEETPWLRSVELSKQIVTFMTAIWPQWRDLGKPPPDASQLRICLFEAVRACPTKIPTVRQLHNIVRTPIGTVDTLFDAKALEVIEGHARDDWAASTSLHAEFTSEESYLAYRRAEAEGLITFKLREEKSESNFTAHPAKSCLTTDGGSPKWHKTQT